MGYDTRGDEADPHPEGLEKRVLGTSLCSLHAQHTVKGKRRAPGWCTRVGVLEEGAVDKLLVGE